MSNVERLILRFRDLGRELDSTIRIHEEICSSNGSVWWGWWSRPNEVVPQQVFNEMRTKARQSTTQVFLLDSGQFKMYEATCKDIHWNIDYQPTNAPEEGRKTPQYYRDSPYPAWFEFSSFTPAPNADEILRSSYSYVNIPEFFVNGPKQDPFEDKVVYSMQELLQQHRTLWFIRQQHNEDSQREIELTSSDRLIPEHFPKHVISTNSANLVWVSDLHFNHEGYHAYPVRASDDPLTKVLEKNLLSLRIRDEVAGMLISGDLTWSAKEEEFEEAVSFVKWSEQSLRISEYNHLVCPGNHDIKFSEENSLRNMAQMIFSQSTSEGAQGLSVEWLEEKLSDARKEWAKRSVPIASTDLRREYDLFYEKIYNLKPNEFGCSGRKMLIGNAVPVEIVSLNSNYLEQHRGSFQGHGFVSEKQLNFVADSMGWDRNNHPDYAKPLRIVMLHQHLLPVSFREKATENAMYSVTLDAEEIMRWLIKHEVNLVLHGHMHQPFWTKLRRTRSWQGDEQKEHELCIVGLGSTGVTSTHIGEIGKRTFGVLEFKARELNVKVYAISDTDGTSEKVFTVPISYSC